MSAMNPPLINHPFSPPPPPLKPAVPTTVNPGLVVFVPSFAYEQQLVSRWTSTGLWSRLGRVKHLFHEPREASELDQLLREYAAAIEANFDAHPSDTSPSEGGADPRAAGKSISRPILPIC